MTEYFSHIEFAYPSLLWLLLCIPLIAFLHLYYPQYFIPSIRVASLKPFLKRKTKKPLILHRILLFTKLLALALFIIASARPQSTLRWESVTTEGIDIILTMDISGSMLAKDFKPNRLEAAKEVAIEFVKKRPNDRIGIVLFSGEAFTQCPLTTDHSVLIHLIKDIRNGMIEDGTSIGMGLATALNRLKHSESKSKIVILLTDGFNTGGTIPPLTAAEIAKTLGIRVYTIGIGTNGLAPMPYRTPYGTIEYEMTEVRIDEKTLQAIANMTEGSYYRATNIQQLRKIYEEIDSLEKTKIEVSEFRRKSEEYFPFLLTGLCLMTIEFFLRKILLKSVVA